MDNYLQYIIINWLESEYMYHKTENFDEFGKSEWIRQSLTCQFTQISAFSMKMLSNLPKIMQELVTI